MIERASSCLNRGGQGLVTLPLRLRSNPRAIQTAFWNHGAGEIQLPDWWNDYLHNPDTRKLVRQDISKQEPFKSLFLDFLYPFKTIAIAQQLAIRQSRRSGKEGKRFTSSHHKRDGGQIEEQRHVSHEVEPVEVQDVENLDAERPAGHDLEENEITRLDPRPGQIEKKHQRNSKSIVTGRDSNRGLSLSVVTKDQTKNDDLDALALQAMDELYAFAAGQQDIPPTPTRYMRPIRIPGVDDSVESDNYKHDFEKPYFQTMSVTDEEGLEQAADDLASVAFWYEKSQELGKAYEAYLNSLKSARAIPQFDNHFRLVLDLEVPIIQKLLEASYDAGTKFLDSAMHYLYTKVLHKDRSNWSEQQWLRVLNLTILYPHQRTDSRQRLGMTEKSLPAGQEGTFELLREALSRGRALPAIRKILTTALSTRRFNLMSALIVFLRTRDLGTDAIFAFADNIGTALLMQQIRHFISFYQESGYLKLSGSPDFDPSEHQFNYLNTVNELTKRMLQRTLGLDINVAAYERMWMHFQNYYALKDKHFTAAIQQLLNVEADDPAELSAFVALAYKLFRRARRRPSFYCSKMQFLTLLHKMIATQHTLCWEAFCFYRATFGYNANLYKTMLSELSRRGDVEHWQEVFDELQAKDVVDEYTMYLQLMTAYSKRADVVACQRLFTSIKAKTGRSPGIEYHKILLQSYVQADQMSEAVKLLKGMQRLGLGNDLSTRLVLLRGLASRGEISLVLEQISAIQATGVQLDSEMLELLIHAYAENHDMSSAESTLYEALESPTDISKAPVWNAMLFASANTGNLSDVNYFHGLMQTHGIREDEKTMAALMKAFCVIGRPDVAFRLLSTVLAERNMAPTVQHCHIVMRGYFHQEKYDMVLRIYDIAKKQCIKPNTAMHVLAIRATSSYFGEINKHQTDWYTVKHRATANTKALLQEILNEHKSNNRVSNMARVPNVVLSQGMAELEFEYSVRGRPVSLSEQQKGPDLLRQYELFHRERFPRQQPKSPLKILAAIAEHYLRVNRLSAITKVWLKAQRMALPFAIRTHADASMPNWVLPSRSLALVPMIKYRMRQLIRQQKHFLLKQEIERLCIAGWRLSSPLWNKFIVHLCQTGDTDLAIRYCEKYLISGFPGWPSIVDKVKPIWNVIETQQQAIFKLSKAQPEYKTLVWLAKSYTGLLRDYAYAVDQDEALSELRAAAPKTIEAIISMPIVDDKFQRAILLGSDPDKYGAENPSIKPRKKLMHDAIR